MSSGIKNSLIKGFLAAIGLILFYFAVMLLFTGSLKVAVSQIRQLLPWISLLVAGFGTQVGLYSYLRQIIKRSDLSISAMTATNTGISGVSMVACCAHHLADVLPLLGLASLSLFLTKYQTWLIGVGIVSNAIGILYLIKQIRKHHVYVKK